MANIAILGGSGRLGEAIVRKVAPGNRVRFAYFSKAEEAHRLASELAGTGCDIAPCQVDVRDFAAVETFFAEAAGAQGLDGVVSANGARFPVCPLYEAEEADLRRIVDVDIFGTFNIMKAATRLMGESGGGSIVIFLTAAIIRTARYDGMSSIPKAALAGMVRQLARDAGPLNVRCNGIAPGIVDTDKVADIAALPGYTRLMVEEFFDDTVLGRFTSLETIAGLASFLLSTEARDISGQIVAADGGYSA